jgi:putative flippase GtrA
MPIPIPAIYILFLLATAVVLAFVLEFVPAYRDCMRWLCLPSGDEPSDQRLDRPDVLLRLATLGGPPVLAALAAVIVAYWLNPQWTWWALNRISDHPSYFVLFAAALSLVALLCGVKPRQPALLVCMTVPALAIMAIVELPIALFVFFFQPGVWILLFIGIGQARVLRQSEGNFTPGGLVRLLLILFAYLYGFIS